MCVAFSMNLTVALTDLILLFHVTGPTVCESACLFCVGIRINRVGI